MKVKNSIHSKYFYSKHPILNNNKATQTGPADILWRLPHLDIFFRPLKEQFTTTQLLDSQKLQYLKTSSKGDAAKLFTLVTIIDANYTVALKMLRDRYQNNRMILRAHVNAIFVQEPLTKETAKDFGQLLETVEEHRLALDNMGQPVNQQDVFLVQLITEKLPSEKFCELSTPGTESQTYDNLKKFLDAKCQALEAATVSTPPTSTLTQPRITTRQNSQPS